MKKIRSKKGYTLVELIVTVAIMSITAGFGIAIFSSALQNYSTASVTSNEQEKALEIENYILRHARVATDIYFIKNDNIVPDPDEPSDASFAPESSIDYSAVSDHYAKTFADINLDNAVGGVITKGGSSRYVEYYDLDQEDNSDPSAVPSIVKSQELTVYNVDSIEFKLYKQKAAADEESLDTFTYLSYKINMEEGYSVSGSVVLYNCKNVSFVNEPDSYVESTSDNVFTVGGKSDTGIAFLKQ